MASEDEALAAFGLKRDGPEPEDAAFDVWPENWRAVQVFASLGTQWTVGMAGSTGLRYEALPFVFEMQGVDRAQWPELFDQIRVCEVEALKLFAERRDGARAG
ncbi:MAG: hypothetical protein RLZZ524_1598 [Pseudomonadota bacterium]